MLSPTALAIISAGVYSEYMRTTDTKTKKAIGTLFFTACYAHDGSYLASAFSFVGLTNRKDILARPLHNLVRYADSLGTGKVMRTVTTIIN